MGPCFLGEVGAVPLVGVDALCLMLLAWGLSEWGVHWVNARLGRY
ncbi:MAG: hypothetical protein ACYDA6_00075 [Solirubrobacteraceae bacterium]